MILVIKLLLAHFLGDFLLQPEAWVKDKNENKHLSSKLYLHILLHMVLMLIITFDRSLIVPILLIGILHYVIDLGKLSIQNESNKRLAFIIDQLCHIAVIIGVANYNSPFISISFLDSYGGQIILMLLTLLLITTVSSKTIKILISQWSPQTEDSEADSLKNAGSYIGKLERLFIFAFVVTGNLQAVGFLLAAKSVFRFGDLKESKDRKLTEYILIGTLVSFGIVILISFLYLRTSELVLIK